jgi:diguanylate cyclase (GGDEF)-like protein/PAS domain S-box-containing protein/putative nucleotidyltransferase with HDIG domain
MALCCCAAGADTFGMVDEGQPRRAVPPAIVTVDSYGRLIRVDDAGTALLGAPEEDLLAIDAKLVLRIPDGTLVPPAEHPATVAIRTGRAVPSAVYALERLYQRWAWVRVSAVPANGGADVELVDLSDDEALVAALERARRLESVLHQIDDYVYVWEYFPDGTSRPVAESIPSRTFFAISEDAEALADEDLWRLRVHPDDRHLYDAVTTAQSEGRGGTGEYRLTHEDGTVVHVFDRWHGFTRRDGVAVVQGVISDVTTMREAEAAERASEERFQVLADSAPVGIYVADADGRLLYANDRWHEIYGLPGEDALGEAWVDAVHPDDRELAFETWRTAVEQATTFDATFRLWQPGGEERWISSRGSPLRDVTGVLTGFVGTDDDVTARVRATQELERLSQTDALTGLANRRRINDRIEAAVEQARAKGGTPAVLMLDVDHFKEVNDVYGHQAGDVVLEATAARISAALRAGEEAGRWGGEEFIVLVPEVRDPAALTAAADRIRAAVSATPISAAGAPLTIQASAGAALLTATVESASVLVDRADRALYAAKRRGRNRTVRYDQVSMSDLASEEAPVLRIARGLALAATIREGMPELHFEQVAELAVQIAQTLDLPDGLIMRCRLGGLLHDIGKLAIPDRILAKRGPLDDEEWAIMRGHAEIGAQIIARVGGLDAAVEAVRHHHERYDGTGYPEQLEGDAIPIEARIVAAADAFSAITSDRAYARGRDFEHALEEIERSAGSHLDPTVAFAVRRAIEARRAIDAERLAQHDAA